MNEHVPLPPAPASNSGWWTREHSVVLVLVATTVLALYLCYLLLRPFLPALAWAVALAVVAHPLHARLCRLLRHPNISAGLSVAIVAIVIVAPAWFVTQQLVREASAGLERIRASVESGSFEKAVEKNGLVSPAVRWLSTQVNAREALDSAASKLTERASALVAGSVWSAMELLITFFMLFYFFRDSRAVLGTLRRMVPLSNIEADELFTRVAETIGATIYGTLVVALVQGTLGGLMFWLLGLPAPLFWGVIMSLLAIVPVLGTFVVWVPAAVFLALDGDWTKAVILAIWGGVVIALIDNLLYPVLVGKKMRLHTLPVFIAIVGGLFVFGASGVILGPVVLAVTQALIEVWRCRTAGGKPLEAGVHP